MRNLPTASPLSPIVAFCCAKRDRKAWQYWSEQERYDLPACTMRQSVLLSRCLLKNETLILLYASEKAGSSYRTHGILKSEIIPARLCFALFTGVLKHACQYPIRSEVNRSAQSVLFACCNCCVFCVNSLMVPPIKKRCHSQKVVVSRVTDMFYDLRERAEKRLSIVFGVK